MSLRSQTISALESLHKSGDEVDRCNVIRTLGVLKASESVPLLIKSLRDEDIDVCVDAAENLGKIGSVEAIPSLIESLENDPDGEIRTAIVDAIGAIAQQHPDSVEAIDTLLQISYKRPENLEFLGEWDDWWDMQLNAVKALGKLGVEKAVPIMDEILTSDDHQDIESEVLTALAQIGSSGHTLLQKRLKAGPDRDRRRAAQALGHAATPESLTMLAEGLLDSAGEVREATLQSLAQRQAAQYIKAILIYLRDPDPEVKAAAMASIEQLGKTSGNIVHPDQVNEKLLPLFSDSDAEVRTAALKFIANYNQAGQFSKPLQKAILKTIADPVSSVAAAACDTIAKLQYEEAIPDLLLTLRKQDINPAVRRQAALALSKMPTCSEEMAKALTSAIAAPQQPVRLGALQALSEIYAANKVSDDTILGTLLAAARRELIEEQLEEESATAQSEEPPEETPEETSQEAHQEAGEIESAQSEQAAESSPEPTPESDEKPISTLDAILNANVEGEKAYQEHLDEEAAKESAANSPAEPSEQGEDDALQEYYDILDNQKASSKKRHKVKTLPLAQDVQLLAIRMLPNLSINNAVEPLLELLQSEDELVQKEAAASFEEMAKQSTNKEELINIFGALMNRLEFGDPGTKMHAARALGHLGHPEALNMLQQSVSVGENDVRIAALEGINHLLQQTAGKPDNEEHMVSEPVAYDQVFDAINLAMLDDAVGIRIAAAETLTNARNHHQNIYDQQQLISKLITTALQGEGGQARQIGQMLHYFDPELSLSQLLTKLDNTEHSVERRFIIEMIEELLTSSQDTQLSA